MNYYALFVGALFVAFYSLGCHTGCDCKCSTPTELFLSHKGMLVLIALLGIISTTCWMASLIGNCAWMNSYVRILKEKENIFFGPIHQSDTQGINIYRYIMEDERTTMRPGFISTQKVTKWFVGAVLMAWIYMFIYLAWRIIEICIYGTAGILINILLSFCATLLIYYFLQHCTSSAFSCDLRGMIR